LGSHLRQQKVGFVGAPLRIAASTNIGFIVKESSMGFSTTHLAIFLVIGTVIFCFEKLRNVGSNLGEAFNCAKKGILNGANAASNAPVSPSMAAAKDLGRMHGFKCAVVGAALVLPSVPVLAQMAGLTCQQRAEMLHHSAKVWHEVDHPAALAANLLGLIQGRAEHRLVLVAFAQMDARVPEAQAIRTVRTACEAIPPRQFDELQSFYEEGGNTPPHLTACSGLMSNMLSALDLPEGELAASIAAQAGPQTRRWVRQVLSTSPPRPNPAAAKAAVARAFDQCSSEPVATRSALARELYAP
jgi:Sec-independent protein translocase protein TatA